MNFLIFTLVGFFLVLQSSQSPLENDHHLANGTVPETTNHTTAHDHNKQPPLDPIHELQSNRTKPSDVVKPGPVPNQLTKEQLRKLFEQSQIPESNECRRDQDCGDAHAVCYQRVCYCRHGYTRKGSLNHDGSRCVRINCKTHADCKHADFYSRCSKTLRNFDLKAPTFDVACVCESGYDLNPETQHCEKRNDPIASVKGLSRNFYYTAAGVLAAVVIVGGCICVCICRCLCRKKNGQ